MVLNEIMSLALSKDHFVINFTYQKFTTSRYAWSILNCKQCQIHLGWKFSATKKELVPYEFWGVKNSSIEIEYDRDLEKVTGRRMTPRFRIRLPRIIWYPDLRVHHVVTRFFAWILTWAPKTVFWRFLRKLHFWKKLVNNKIFDTSLGIKKWC